MMFWIAGGWLSWCVLRWGQPLLGLVPGAAAFATNVLNYPADQNGYTLAFLVVTLFLLLWTSYLRSLDHARRTRIKLSSDARWDFWETGIVVMALVVALGIFEFALDRRSCSIGLTVAFQVVVVGEITGGFFRAALEIVHLVVHFVPPVVWGLPAVPASVRSSGEHEAEEPRKKQHHSHDPKGLDRKPEPEQEHDQQQSDQNRHELSPPWPSHPTCHRLYTHEEASLKPCASSSFHHHAQVCVRHPREMFVKSPSPAPKTAARAALAIQVSMPAPTRRAPVDSTGQLDSMRGRRRVRHTISHLPSISFPGSQRPPGGVSERFRCWP